MKLFSPTPLLGACIALALAASAAAQAPKTKVRTADAPTQAQLDAAQADLERAARRLAELQGKLGAQAAPDVHIFERRMMKKPVIGVVLAPDAQAGVRVAGVTPDSGAAKAGLKAGDRITAVGGTQVLGSNGDLRLDNARKLFVGMDEGKPIRIDYVRAGKAASANVTASLDQDVFWVGGPDVNPQLRRIDIDVPGVGEDVRQEVIRIGPRGDCKGKNCKVPMLAEAFRWNGLNLASVEGGLGRYFGTDKGVLVLSAGPDLEGLQPGDVIQKIDGRAVNSPREAMEALRAKEDNATALVEYLRDRRVASTRVKVPEISLKFMTPPPPPSLPRAPKAPPVPPPPPPPPPAAFIDDDGAVTLLQTQQLAFIGDDGNVELEFDTPPDNATILRDVQIKTN